MKNIMVSLFVLSTVFVSVQPAYAVLDQNLRETVRETVKEGRDESLSPAAIRKNVREDVKIEVKERNENLIDRVKNFVKKRVRFDARITGEVTSVGANALTITGEDGKTYILNINSGTKLVRRFGGNSTLAEFKVGNKVNAFGEFANEEKTTINVKLVRNVSIQKRWGVFFGTVKSKGDTSFTLESSNKGTQTVFIEGAEFKNRREEGMNYADVQVEQRVRVKGMWDRSTNDITDVDEVRNFSVPTQAVEN